MRERHQPEGEPSRGFPPVAAPDARVLILGSLPGRQSLAERRYYAQPRNAFWQILGEFCGAVPTLDYVQRLVRLRAARIALWDVIAAGRRPGSLDSAIVRDSIVINDFVRFFASHPQIRVVCFNGTTAATLFRRWVQPQVAEVASGLYCHTLPSTSPAHASVPYARKRDIWLTVLDSAVDAKVDLQKRSV